MKLSSFSLFLRIGGTGRKAFTIKADVCFSRRSHITPLGDFCFRFNASTATSEGTSLQNPPYLQCWTIQRAPFQRREKIDRKLFEEVPCCDALKWRPLFGPCCKYFAAVLLCFPLKWRSLYRHCDERRNMEFFPPFFYICFYCLPRGPLRQRRNDKNKGDTIIVQSVKQRWQEPIQHLLRAFYSIRAWHETLNSFLCSLRTHPRGNSVSRKVHGSGPRKVHGSGRKACS